MQVVGVICSISTFNTATSSSAVGIPTDLSITGKYVKKISVSNSTASSVTVTATMDSIPELGTAGSDTVIYNGVCDIGQLLARFLLNGCPRLDKILGPPIERKIKKPIQSPLSSPRNFQAMKDLPNEKAD
ncbi:hypothetical protein H8L32_20485 [Undibacterium sp. CY18W]|uniref:Uncharacterized protein n=1 Tax=Undibacterium hunanense TaxID=2762292 RepID=A0ABR6ZW20_9BURK|nr:hypothetical protein [Undibacterium hunanense]MBC3919859.1 hypothetical protein [Undibacterium hunanense]